MEIEIFQNEFGGSFRSTGRLIWIQHAILGSKWGTRSERLHLKQTCVVTTKGRQTLLWNIQPRLTMLPVWDRNNWHGSLWRPTYVSRRGEVRRSYKNKSLKRRHKRKVKKLEGERNPTCGGWKGRSETVTGVLEKSVFDLFWGSTQEKATAAKLAANSIRVSSEWHRRGGGGVIHLRFWRGLSAPCHSSILPRKHKEHYAWSPEGLRASTMLSPGSAA